MPPPSKRKKTTPTATPSPSSCLICSGFTNQKEQLILNLQTQSQKEEEVTFDPTVAVAGPSRRSPPSPPTPSVVTLDLSTLFVLKTLLQVPSSVIEELLVRTTSPPSKWGVRVCEDCQGRFLSRATAIHSKIAALQAELDGVKQEAREQVVLSMRVKGEGQPSPSGRKRKKGPAENSPGFAYSKVRDWILNNSGKKVMEGVEAILEAAGGLEEYQTQLHLESAFKGKGRKLVDEKSIDNGTSHKNGNAAAATTKEIPVTTSSSLISVSSVSAVNGSNDALSKEKKAAAEAALTRIAALQQKEDESKRIVARQAALIKEIAKQELEATSPEKNSDESVPHPESPLKNGITKSKAPTHPFSLLFTIPQLGLNNPIEKASLWETVRSHLLARLKEQGSGNPYRSAELSVQLIRACNRNYSPDQISACLDLLYKILDNIVQNPKEEKFQQIRIGNRAFQEKVAPLFGVEAFLKAVGFTKGMLPNKHTWNEEEEEYWIYEGQWQGEEEDEVGFFVEELAKLRNLLKTTSAISPVLHRNPRLVTLKPEEVPDNETDDFYELSKDEIKKEQEKKTEIADRELTLRTKAMRERDDIVDTRVFQYGLVRVKFPDGKALEGTFKAQEKLTDVYQFVQNSLISPDLDFDLIKAGAGGKDLNREETLQELHFLPTVTLSFKMDNVPEGIASGAVPYVSMDLFSNHGKD